MSIGGTNFTQLPKTTNDEQIESAVQEVTQGIRSLSLRKGLSDAHCAIIIPIDSEQSDGSIHKILGIATIRSIKPEIIVQPLLRPRLDHENAYAFRRRLEIKPLDNDIIATIDSNKKIIFFTKEEKTNLLKELDRISKLILNSKMIGKVMPGNIDASNETVGMLDKAVELLDKLDKKRDFITILPKLRDMMDCLAKAHMFSRIIDPSVNKEMNTFFAKIEASIDTIATRIIKQQD